MKRKSSVTSLARIFCLFVLVFSLVGCATTRMATIQVNNRDYQKVWRACVAALPDVYFSVSSSDLASGLIIADQAVFGGRGQVSRLNISVEKRSSDVVTVNITYVPPPGTVGPGGAVVDKYIEALKKRLPNVKEIQTQERSGIVTIRITV